ncbi:hypothetical protein ACRYJU_07350 [Alloalcanivorax xenomutans]|uniref:hypothetical protein n=1 Tax=Alloalcanivorax xenomutans TaxID=1094342 RepID=UPI003D9B66A9
MRNAFVSIALGAAASIAIMGLVQLAVTATEVLVLIDCKQTGAHDFGGAVITCQVEDSQ